MSHDTIHAECRMYSFPLLKFIVGIIEGHPLFHYSQTITVIIES